MDGKIPKVAVAGATGNVGRAVLKHLLATQFEVTALIRHDSTKTSSTTFPAGVTTKTIDPLSLQSLTSALRGHDAVVDATRAPDDAMTLLVDAAAAAGVYRFIPSDFSLDPSNASLNALPIFAGKASRDAHLAARCSEGSSEMTWTIVANGPFLDWNLQTGFMQIDLFGRRATLMDGGENVTVWTTLDAVGSAVAEVLLHPAETENRAVYISSVAKSPAQMLALAREVDGEGGGGGATNGSVDVDGDGWQVTSVDGAQAFQGAMEAVKAGKMDPSVFGTMILYANSRPEMAHPWPKPDNELLGVKQMSDEEVKELMREILKKGPLKM